jgi:hypothetical protein
MFWSMTRVSKFARSPSEGAPGARRQTETPAESPDSKRDVPLDEHPDLVVELALEIATGNQLG